MKMVKEEKPVKSERKQTDLKPVNDQLLARLKELRLSIAKGYGVPAFTVFHDSSLIDMCMKMPQTEEGFLEVSGVGKLKCERYSKQFLSIISEFCGESSKGENEFI